MSIILLLLLGGVSIPVVYLGTMLSGLDGGGKANLGVAMVQLGVLVVFPCLALLLARKVLLIIGGIMLLFPVFILVVLLFGGLMQAFLMLIPIAFWYFTAFRYWQYLASIKNEVPLA